MCLGKNKLALGVALRFLVVHFAVAGVNAKGAVEGAAGEGNGLYQRLQIVPRGNRSRSTHRSLFETFVFSGVTRSANLVANILHASLRVQIMGSRRFGGSKLLGRILGWCSVRGKCQVAYSQDKAPQSARLI